MPRFTAQLASKDHCSVHAMTSHVTSSVPADLLSVHRIVKLNEDRPIHNYIIIMTFVSFFHEKKGIELCLF